MRLAAIYIEDHEYLFEEPQTINFGGQYLYEFENKDNNILVTKTLNENFIPDFFNLTNVKSKITNLNAIVGQNGAGKSTILDLIRSQFVGHNYVSNKSNSLFLLELENSSNPIVLINDFNTIYLKNSIGAKTRTQLSSKLPYLPQVIFYSPHYDYKYNSEIANEFSHDLSFDRILEQDLDELEYKDTNENGFPYSPSQELIFKNSLRQINFLSSVLVKDQNIFKDLFQLQDHYEPILHFRGYNVKEKEWNTPYDLRSILRTIDQKLEKEKKDGYLIRKFNGTELLNEIEVTKYFLKRNVIKCILSVLYLQMERKNSYLQEGVFPYTELNSLLEKADAYQSLLIFAEHSYISVNSKTKQKIFRDGVFQELLAKIYATIDKTSAKYSITNSTLKTSKEDAIEILKHQRQFLNELNTYYAKFYSNKDELTIKEGVRIEEFINYMPFSRRMSSGETSLLNFFSRIYDFLNTNLKEVKFREPSNHYILLLDEADLTFHLSWKKKYVKALLKTLPYFFNELENTPTFEIIITTHDPITLSDLPNANVIYIERLDYDSPPTILAFNNKNRPTKTFGANISDLIADSFFIENGLTGEFAKEKISRTLEWLKREVNKQKKVFFELDKSIVLSTQEKNKEYHKKIIELIGEPLIKHQLKSMYMEFIDDNDYIENEIEKLQKLKK